MLFRSSSALEVVLTYAERDFGVQEVMVRGQGVECCRVISVS